MAKDKIKSEGEEIKVFEVVEHVDPKSLVKIEFQDEIHEVGGEVANVLISKGIAKLSK